MQLAQIAKIVSCRSPLDMNGVAQQGARLNMANYECIAFIISFGVMTGAVTPTVASSNGTLVAGTDQGYYYRIATTGARLVSVLEGAFTYVAAAGVAIPATDDDKVMVIEVKASELTVLARQYVGVTLTGGATPTIVSVVGVCFWPRYAAEANLMPDPTVA